MTAKRQPVSLRVMIYICQTTTLLPFKYNLKTKNFEKSNFSHMYSIIFAVAVLISTLYCFFLWIQLIPVVHYNFISTICFFGLISMITFLLFNRVYMLIFKSSEMLNMFKSILNIFQIISEEKNSIVRKMRVYYILDFIIIPIMMMSLINQLMITFKFSVRIISVVLMCNYIWSMTTLFPLHVAFEIFLVFFKESNKQINAILKESKKSEINLKLATRMEEISQNYLIVVDLINHVCHYYRLNILIILLAATMSIIRKAYILITLFYNYKINHLPSYVFETLTMDFLMHAVVFCKILVLLVRRSFLIKAENTATKLILHNVDKNFKSKFLIDSVRFNIFQ